MDKKFMDFSKLHLEVLRKKNNAAVNILTNNFGLYIVKKEVYHEDGKKLTNELITLLNKIKEAGPTEWLSVIDKNIPDLINYTLGGIVDDLITCYNTNQAINYPQCFRLSNIQSMFDIMIEIDSNLRLSTEGLLWGTFADMKDLYDVYYLDENQPDDVFYSLECVHAIGILTDQMINAPEVRYNGNTANSDYISRLVTETAKKLPAYSKFYIYMNDVIKEYLGPVLYTGYTGDIEKHGLENGFIMKLNINR